MSDKKRPSLFSDQLDIVQKNPGLSKSQETEKQRMLAMHLKPLILPEKKSFWDFKWLLSPTFSSGLVAAACLFLAVLYLPKPDVLHTKGSMKISVYWERQGVVHPLDAESTLSDGDRIGASVITTSAAVAYWAIADGEMQILSETSDVDASKISLEPGVSKTFGSSFTLVAPNQGEHLIVIVCPKDQEDISAVVENLTRSSLAKILSSEQARSENCVFTGHRLRKLESL